MVQDVWVAWCTYNENINFWSKTPDGHKCLNGYPFSLGVLILDLIVLKCGTKVQKTRKVQMSLFTFYDNIKF
jgi:hypothetical protein